LKLSRYSEAEEVDATHYRRIVGSLRYLVHTRPDLAFAVGYVSRFMERPTVEHQQAIKRILRYVSGTIDYGLHYGRHSDATSPATLTQARARAVLCSSLATVQLVGSQSSNGWWHSLAAKLSTSPPPRPQLKHCGWLGCWGSFLEGGPKQWSSGWTASLPLHLQRIQSSMNAASTFGSNIISSGAALKMGV
jgi:hypothetical protein